MHQRDINISEYHDINIGRQAPCPTLTSKIHLQCLVYPPEDSNDVSQNMHHREWFRFAEYHVPVGCELWEALQYWGLGSAATDTKPVKRSSWRRSIYCMLSSNFSNFFAIAYCLRPLNNSVNDQIALHIISFFWSPTDLFSSKGWELDAARNDKHSALNHSSRNKAFYIGAEQRLMNQREI